MTLVLIPLDAFGMPLGQFNFRFYMVPAVLVIVSGMFAMSSKSFGLVSQGPILLLGAVTFLGAASVFWSSSPADTVGAMVGQGFLLAWMLAMVKLWKVGDYHRDEAVIWLEYGLFASVLIGLFQSIASILTGSDFGTWYSLGIPWPRPNGGTREPVWAALNASLCLGISLWGPKETRSWLIRLCSIAALLLTASRAAMAAVFVATLVVAYRSGKLDSGDHARGRGDGAVRRALIGSVSVGLALYLIIPETARARLFGSVLGGYESSNDQGAFASRLGMVQLIRDRWYESPVLGHGVGSLAPLAVDPLVRLEYAGGGELNSGRGSTNVFYATVFDLGLTGLVLMLLLFYFLFRICVLAEEKGVLALGLVSLVLIQLQASNGFRLGVVWAVFVLAILASGRELERARP